MTKYYNIIKIIGKTNVGKSSIFNKIFKKKISITSKKKNLTNKEIISKYEYNNKTLFYIDTPGLNQFKITNTNNNIIFNFIIEINKITQEEINLINKLSLNNYMIVIINKIDKSTKEKLFKFINFIKDKISFNHLLAISSFKEKDITILKTLNYNLTTSTTLINLNNTYNLEFNKKEFFKEIIREKFFRNLGDEIPYKITNYLIDIKELNNKIFIYAEIFIQKKYIKICIGKNGILIKKIINSTIYEFKKYINKEIELKIDIKKN